MKYSLTAIAVFAATVAADLCADGSVDDGGNYYCQEVDAITYMGVGGSGSYNRVTGMGVNEKNEASCSSEPFSYSGSLAPFDEEVSLHFRGPIHLKEFAFYSSSSSPKKARRSEHVRRHAHGHAHGHARAHEARALGDAVTATIDGKVVTWANDWSGEATTTAAPAAAATSSDNSNVVANIASAVESAVGGVVSAITGGTDSPSSSSGWSRGGYYNAASGTSDGLSFLNHLGGVSSGTFDMTFGNSLSYSSADGCKSASSNTVLGDVTIPSNEEVVIMTDTKCSDKTGCGFSRKETVAYHGFNGASKAFFFTFQMPDDGTTGWNANMPAIWMLNAAIPRTLQYGEATCSCWASGCGEFDIFEVLASGDKRAKSTVHGNIAGGNSDYFARPCDSFIKVGVVLYDDNFHIKVLDDSVNLSAITDDDISDIVSSTKSQTKTVSLFAMAGAKGDSTA